MKKTISILVIVAMMLASILAIIPVAAADPEGSPITNADEFAAMEAEGKYYLANDITLKASYGDFKGTLDGNGKTITLVGNVPTFKTLTGATVKNVNLVANFEETKLSGDYGALAGTVNGGTYTGINADVTANFTAVVTNHFGAIFGLAKGTNVIENCTATGSINNPSKHEATEQGVGGIIGKVDGGNTTVRNCVNYFDIYDLVCRSSKGGIIGLINATPVTVETCVNYGSVTAVVGGTGSNVHCGNGGIVGQFQSPNSTTPELKILNCRNYADVTAVKVPDIASTGNCMLGGILGRIYGSKYVTIEGCINSGNITSEDDIGTWTCIGGIIGNAETWNFTWSPITEADLVFKYCINLGTISGASANVGGIFGGLLQGNSPSIQAFMNECANYGDISGKHAGGIFGSVAEGGAATIILNNSYNAGAVTGTTSSGGILARIQAKWDTSSAAKDKDIIQNGELPFPGATLTNCVNDGAVSGGTSGTIWGTSNSPAKLIKSASTVEGELTGFSEVELTPIDKSVDEVKTALLALIPANPAELTALVVESEDMFEDDYKSGWDAYADAIATAKEAINQCIDNATAAEVLAAVNAAKADLVPIDAVNNADLVAAIADADTINNPDGTVYTPATWAAFDAARTAAKGAVNAEKQSTVNKALNALVAAMEGLEEIPDRVALEAAINAAKALTEADYVTATWAELAAIVVKAEALLVDENATGSQVNAIMADMAAATAALDKKVDPAPLTEKITATEKDYPRDVYTAMSYGKVTTAIRNAQDAVTANDMGQATLNALSKAIDDAVAGLAKRATFAGIDAILEQTANYLETDYTPDSWKVYAEAVEDIDNAKKEDKKPNVSEADEAKLLEKLEAAIAALVPYATYGELDTRVKEVNAMDKAKYTAESWAVVQAALDKVGDLKSNRYATQPEADALLEEINAAVDALVEATAGGDNTTAETQAPTTGNTTDDTKEGGCGGFIATTAVVMASVLALGAAVVAKKKED